MARLRCAVLIAMVLFLANPPANVFAQIDEKRAVESTVRAFEQAVQEFDFSKANSLLAPDARWIEEESPPAPANEWSQWWQDAKAAKLRMTNRPHDFEIHIHGEVAWVTVFVDTTIKVDNDAARALTKNNHPNEREWTTHAVETEVLLKTPHGWKIVLGHTSILPKER
jgi:ketosteroid isomerase-like protein